MKKIATIILAAAAIVGCTAANTDKTQTDAVCEQKAETCCQKPVVGAAQPEEYVPLLKGKRVALFSNHTGTVGDKHTVDVLRDNGINVVTLFSPEHGFRGTADAGEHVSSSIDGPTGLPIVSLYGSKAQRTPSKEVLDGIDVIVCDIQDVGLRFYTYYCTMIDLMNAAKGAGKEFVVFDRPNPNGMYVDGPILDMKYSSGVGRLPIPVVHGMTLGEIALMANGEGWLANGGQVPLTVIPVKNYTHHTRYELPVAPSPNLKSMKAIYLYPAMCYFEATPVSLGRGTDRPFEMYGHPAMKKGGYSFTPRSMPGAKEPPQLGKLCYGVDLGNLDNEEIIARGIDLSYLIDAYNQVGMGDKFFRSFFELLIGRGDIRKMIEEGRSADEIKATWAGDVEKFKKQRRPYLLYEE